MTETKLSDEQAAGYIKEIFDRYGGFCSADVVLSEATDAEHPLHGEFTWDNTKAGHLWRLHEARKLITRVEAIIIRNRVEIRTIAHVRNPALPPRVGGYVAVTVAARDAQMRHDILVQELTRIESAINRCENLALGLGEEELPEWDQLRRIVGRIKKKL